MLGQPYNNGVPDNDLILLNVNYIANCTHVILYWNFKLVYVCRWN